MKWTLALLFLASRVIDFLSTYCAMTLFQSAFWEVNPVANVFLQSAGWTGMVLYGVVMSCIAIGLAFYIWRHEPPKGLFVLVFACMSSNVLCVYNLVLLSVSISEIGGYVSGKL